MPYNDCRDAADAVLPGDCTQAEINKHLDGNIEVDEEKAVELARNELHNHMDNVVVMYDPVPCEDQSCEIDSDGQVCVKFEFTVWVDYPLTEVQQ